MGVDSCEKKEGEWVWYGTEGERGGRDNYHRPMAHVYQLSLKISGKKRGYPQLFSKVTECPAHISLE